MNRDLNPVLIAVGALAALGLGFVFFSKKKDNPDVVRQSETATDEMVSDTPISTGESRPLTEQQKTMISDVLKSLSTRNIKKQIYRPASQNVDLSKFL